MQLNTLKSLGSVGTGSGLQGPTGPTGSTGPTGPQGPVGLAGESAGGIIAFAYFMGPLNVFNGTSKQYIFKNTNISTVMLSVQTAAVGAPITVRLNKNGVSIGTFSLSSGSQYIRYSGQTLSVSVDDYLTIDITSIGYTYPGSNLTVQLIV